MKKCDICGHLNDDTQLFCGQCGNKLTNTPPPNQFSQQPPIQNNPQQNTNYQYNSNPQGAYYQPPNNGYNPQQQYPPIIVEKKKPHGCLVTLAVFGVIFLLIIILGSCGSSTSETAKTTSTVTDKAKTEENTTENSKEGIYKFAGIELEYISSKIVKEEYGDDYYLIVNFNYTNNSDSSRAFDDHITLKAFQSGVELQKPVSTYGIPDYDFHKSQKEIKPGVTLIVQEAFRVDDRKSPISIEVYDGLLIINDNPDYQFEIEIKE